MGKALITSFVVLGLGAIGYAYGTIQNQLVVVDIAGEVVGAGLVATLIFLIGRLD